MFSETQRKFLQKEGGAAYRCLMSRAINAGRYDFKPILGQIFPDEDAEKDFEPANFQIRRAGTVDECEAIFEMLSEFNEETDLGQLVEEVYYNGREVLIADSEKSSKYLIYKEGDLYWRTVKEDKDGNEVIEDSLIASLDFQIRNIYTDLSQTFIVYRLPLDREDRVEEVQTALDKIKSTAFLTQTQTNALWRLITAIAPEFLALNKQVKLHGVSVHNNIIEVTVDPTFNIEQILKDLAQLYDIAVDKNAFNFLLLYAPLAVFGFEFRKRNLIFPFTIYYGGGGVGKSALTRKMVVRGLNNDSGDLTEQDIWTLAAFRDHMSATYYPRFIDEVSMDVLIKYSSHLKAMTTGKGTASRGRRTGGHNQWETTATPFFVSNEYISDQYAFNRRAFLLLAEGSLTQMNPALWRKYSKRIPDGFLYIFLNELNGRDIEEFIEEVVSAVQSDEDYIVAYLGYMLNIVRAVYTKYGIECPFQLPHKDEVEYRWEEIFQDYLLEQKRMMEIGLSNDRNALKPDLDYRWKEDGDLIIFDIKRIGFEKFLNVFHRCPYKDLKTFAINAGTKNFEYTQGSWGGSSQRYLRVKIKKGYASSIKDITV